jgi:glycosyltransferase involved in cell wall biosynthesis
MTISTNTHSPALELTNPRQRPWYIKGLARTTAYIITFTITAVLKLFDKIKPSSRQLDQSKPLTILLTAGSASENWLKNHILPLSHSENCRQIILINDQPALALPKIQCLCPPRWLKIIFGRTPSRLMTYFFTAIRFKPDICGGFHLIPNAMLALIAARWTGAQSLYFCVGGRTEFLGGASHNEKFPFGRTGRNDPRLERRLLGLINRFDRIVTMGTGAKKTLQHFGIINPIEVIPGGIDPERFSPSRETPIYEIVITCRMVPVKRLDIFAQVVHVLCQSLPNIRAVIVGDGEQRPALEKLIRDLKIVDNLYLAGQQSDIPSFLRKARAFVLTSDSEGLALSLMEAMMCGLPAVVSDVGDLGDLVENGKNGWLVKRRDVHAFAEKIYELLTNEHQWNMFSKNARESTFQLSISEIARRWTHFLQVDPRRTKTADLKQAEILET